MELDSDTLKKMIGETLSQLMGEGLANTATEDGVINDLEKFVKPDILQALEDDTEEEKEENKAAAAKEEEEEKREANLSTSPATAPSVQAESFQITKGRLRQIIAEEMQKAKEQGLL
jgi:pyruvate/2-oxoglutarate dehydrogenase complex dihydrolipoamide acyltransferase (E2) component